MDAEHGEPPSQSEALTAILARASQGDDEAWRVLIGQYSRRIFALCKSRLGSRELAEEITQSVFVTVAKKLTQGGYVESGKFEPWLFRVAMNRIRDEVRKRGRSRLEPLAEREAAFDESGRADPDELATLRAAVEGLSGPDREIVELRHHAQLSFREIADMTGEPMGTLLARHHRAIRKLKTILEAEAVKIGAEGLSGQQNRRLA